MAETVPHPTPYRWVVLAARVSGLAFTAGMTVWGNRFLPENGASLSP